MFRLLIIPFVFAAFVLSAQTPTLNELRTEASQNWPQLAERRAEVLAATARVAEAKAGYGPQLSFGATYSLAAGGRSIALPLGDLLNPVYGTLNELTQSQNFPQLENTEEQFAPHNFYDARLRLQQPLYRPEIKINQLVKAEQLQISQLAEQISQRDLDVEVQKAYFQYLSAAAAINIYEEAEKLLQEAMRTTRSLIRNGKELPLARSRMEAELARTAAEKSRAQARADNARAYLNYLLGRTLDAPLTVDSIRQLPPEPLTQNTLQREELEQLRSALQVNAYQQAAEDLYFKPKIGLQLDLGSQAFNFAWDPYAILGVAVDVPLWDNRMHRRRQEALQAEQLAAEARLQHTENSFRVQILSLRNQLAADRATYQAYQPAVLAAQRSLRDIQILYREGQTNYLNLVEARTQLTRIQLEHSLALYRTWTTYVEWLRARAIDL